MLKLLEILTGALEYLGNDEGIYPHEVHEIEIEQNYFGQYEQWAVYFPEYHYWCFSIGGGLNDFVGFKCGKEAA